MVVMTVDFGAVRLVKKNKVTRFDTFIKEIEGSEVGQYFDIYQLADGKGSIVAVEIWDEDDLLPLSYIAN